jgi:hypothetical protein
MDNEKVWDARRDGAESRLWVVALNSEDESFKGRIQTDGEALREADTPFWTQSRVGGARVWVGFGQIRLGWVRLWYVRLRYVGLGWS